MQSYNEIFLYLVVFPESNDKYIWINDKIINVELVSV